MIKKIWVVKQETKFEPGMILGQDDKGFMFKSIMDNTSESFKNGVIEWYPLTQTYVPTGEEM